MKKNKYNQIIFRLWKIWASHFILISIHVIFIKEINIIWKRVSWILFPQKLCLSSNLQFTCVLTCSGHVRLFATIWTAASLAPLSMGFSRQEHWAGGHSLLQGVFPAQRSHQCLCPALAVRRFTTSTDQEAQDPWMWLYLELGSFQMKHKDEIIQNQNEP